MDQREYAAAERRFREALEIKESIAETDELSLAISLNIERSSPPLSPKPWFSSGNARRFVIS